MPGLADVIGLIAEDAPLSEVLEAITGVVEAGVTGAVCCVLVVDDAGRQLRVAAAPSVSDDVRRQLEELNVEQHPAARHRRVETTPDIAGDPAWTALRSVALSVNARAAAAFPILTPGDSVLGTIAMYCRTVGEPSAEAIQVLAQAANLATIAIQRRQRATALRRSAERMESRRQIDLAILTAESAEAITNSLLSYLETVVPYQRVGVLLFEPETGDGVVLATRGVLAERFGVGARLTKAEMAGDWLDEARRRGPQIVADLERAPHKVRGHMAKELVAAGMRSWMVVPLIAHGVLIGILNFWSERRGNFTPEHLAVVTESATHMTLAIRQSRMLAQLQAHAVELEDRVTQRTAELQAANHELEAFSYSVSHDLRAPLRTIEGFAAILSEEHAAGLAEDARRLVSQMGAAAGNMGALIDALLRLAQLSRREMAWGQVNLTGLARTLLGDLQRNEPRRQAEVVIADGLLASGDAGLLTVMMANLLSNAWKYSSERSPARIEFGAQAAAAEPRFFVRDNGAGFDMARATRLFTPFQRYHRTARFDGLGIGLATVERIVRRHGGHVWAEAEVDRGATFYFTLGATARGEAAGIVVGAHGGAPGEGKGPG